MAIRLQGCSAEILHLPRAVWFLLWRAGCEREAIIVTVVVFNGTVRA